MKKHKKRVSLLSSLSQSSGVPFDMLGSLPLIKMYSNREIFIEDAGRIIRYDRDLIILEQRKNVLEIKGEALNLKSLADGNISVDGYITSVAFCSEGDEKQ